MTFYLELTLGLLVVSPLLVWVYFARKDSSEHLLRTLNIHRDRRNAIKGDYDKIDHDQ